VIQENYLLVKNEGSQQPTLKKAGKTLRIEIASGLPRDTDTTPTGLSRGPSSSSSTRGGPRGGQRGGPQQTRGAPAPTRGGLPAPQRGGNPTARAMPQPVQQEEPSEQMPPQPVVANPSRGTPTRGGLPAPQRGGPAQRGTTTAPVQRGMAQPQRGGPAQRGNPQAQPQPARQQLPSAPVKAPATTKPSCTAMYDYDAQTADEISFKVGQKIFIVQKDAGGWWEGEVNGKRGWIPANYVQEN